MSWFKVRSSGSRFQNARISPPLNSPRRSSQGPRPWRWFGVQGLGLKIQTFRIYGPGFSNQNEGMRLEHGLLVLRE